MPHAKKTSGSTADAWTLRRVLICVLVRVLRVGALDNRAALETASRQLLCADCSLIPGLGVNLSTIILAGSTVLSAVGACPPHDGVRRRWRINVASAVALSGARTKSDDLTTATVPAGTTFPAVSRELYDLLVRALRGDCLLRPVELGPLDPHAVQDDRELARDSDLRLAEPVALDEPRAPSLESRPFLHAG
jgi:hypothetical protein